MQCDANRRGAGDKRAAARELATALVIPNAPCVYRWWLRVQTKIRRLKRGRVRQNGEDDHPVRQPCREERVCSSTGRDLSADER